MSLGPLRRSFATFAAALVLCLCTVGARAGDFAERAFLGFSGDGRYFAFEQFGIQDGSGFPYSEIFVIDLIADAWVSGTPVRVRLEDEQETLADARRQAHEEVRPTLEQHGVFHPGRLIAAAPVTEAYQDPYELSFRRYSLDTSNGQHTALLEVRDMPPPSGCEGLDVDIRGFTLSVRNDSTGEVVEVHSDTSVPSSRRCPLDYGLSDIVAFPAFERAGVMVLLVNVFSYGFEGPDRRYIAIRIPLP